MVWSVSGDSLRFAFQLNYCSFAAYKLWQDGSVAKKKRKPKKFSAVDQVKAMARAQIGAPPAGRVVPDRREKKIDKHKPTLGKMLESE
jgi:hypothetical protein